MGPLRKRQLSGGYWVGWIKTNAPTSEETKDLDPKFRTKVEEFIKALRAAKIKVKVEHTFRSEQAAYLWHWSWKIAQGRATPNEPPRYAGSAPVPDIEWDHGNLADSIKGAEEMVKGFNLSVPCKQGQTCENASNLPPALRTLHRWGRAIDMTITWSGTIKVMMKGGKELSVTHGPVKTNKNLHKVGASYGVHKLVNGRDDVHWSDDGT